MVIVAACGDPYVLNGYRSPMGVNGLRAKAHAGVDFKGEVGDPVIAAADGLVISVGDDPGAGKSVLIGHNGHRFTSYIHLSEIEVIDGECVLRGQEIGKVGATGTGSGGRSHVHLALCEYPCRYGTADGDFRGVLDPMVDGARCFSAETSYLPSTLTYPIVCGDSVGVPVAPDQRECGRRLRLLFSLPLR